MSYRCLQLKCHSVGEEDVEGEEGVENSEEGEADSAAAEVGVASSCHPL